MDETVAQQCGDVEWDCSSADNTCTRTHNATYMKCVMDVLYTGCTGGSCGDLWTCSNVAVSEMTKSEDYHGSLSDQQCEMDDDRMEVHASVECRSDGPYAVEEVHILDGSNPKRCSSTFSSCLSSSKSEEKLTCVTITASSPGSTPAPVGLTPEQQNDIRDTVNEQKSKSGATTLTNWFALLTSFAFLVA